MASSEFPYQTILSETGILCLLLDEGGVIRYVSPALLEKTGYVGKEIVGKTVHEFVYEEDTHLLEQSLEEDKKGESAVHEIQLKHKTGDKLSVMLTLVSGCEGEDFSGRLVVLQDYTELQEAETRSRLFTSVVENSLDAHLIFRKEPEGLPTLVFANEAFQKLSLVSIDEILSKKTNLVAGLHANQKKLDTISSKVKNGEDVRLEMLLSRKDGSTFWADVNVFPIKNMGEKVSHYTTILHDLTETKKREAELKEVMEQAEASRKTKENLVASMSHEIRTPMNGVLGMAHLLAETELDAEQKEYIEAIESSAESLINMLSDVIEFSAADSGEIEIKRSPFNLRKMFQNLQKVFHHRADKKEIDYSLRIDESLPDTVIGDMSRFLQVLIHLVGNAFKFTEEGYVRIDVQPSQEERHPGQVGVVTVIEDSGIGIPEELTSTIFESFSKASKSTMSQYGGAGLGLSIVKELIGLMDGVINVESVENKGSTITVTIPFQTSTVAEEEIPKEEKIPESNRDEISVSDMKQVLVVDDHPINRRLLKGMLERAGYLVKSVESGEEALRIVSEFEIDLVLMDIHMPGMDGRTTTKRIRAEFDAPKNAIPIIAVSASVMESDIEACRQAGMDGFIAKPFTYETLVEKAGAALEQGEEYQSGFDEIRKSIHGDEDETTVDFSSLREMTAGDPDMMMDMIELFLDQTPKLIQSVRDNYEDGNRQEMAKAAHTLKPTFSYMGIKNAASLIEGIEKFKTPGNEGDRSTQKLEADIEKLEKLGEFVCKVIRKRAKDIRSS